MTDQKRKPLAGWKPGQSGNPAGRPRRGNALAEVIRQKIPVEALVGTVANLLKSPDEKVRLAAATWLRDSAYPRPELRVDLEVATVDARTLDTQRVLAGLSTEALRELVALAEHDDNDTLFVEESLDAADEEPRRFVTGDAAV